MRTAETALPGKRAPAGLSKEGRALWRSVVDDIAARGNAETNFELDPRELASLEHACRLEDRIVELDAVVKKQGLTTRGSTGQITMHPAIAEARQHRLAVQRLLGGIGLDTDSGEKTGAASNRARHAAQARWSRRDWQAEGTQLRVIGGAEQ